MREAGKRTRKKFKVSGEQSVIDFVKSKGGATTAQVAANWNRQGRGGKADNALSALVKAGKLKKEKVEGGRGSRYTAK